ncbi:MAG: metalloregulator ArsR/SmtB family transcription factor, partial [Pseudomonadales bacterium]|nr:metalloregulator ArsR/SmtB family transcription factor [Pseudomonadales bacterium]
MSRSPRPSSAPPARDDLLLLALRACADPVRLTILRLLARDAFGVQELGAVLDLGQATVSHHLKQLVEAELVTARRDGTHVFYRRALPRPERPGAATLAALLAELDAQALAPAQRSALDAVFEERARRSRA